MSFEKESRLRVNRAEGRENNLESKDKQTEELEKKMGARERVEQVSKEVKSTQQQMQNIMMNMQQVVKAVSAIRQQLQLSGAGAIPSVGQDQKVLDDLKERLKNLQIQKDDLQRALLKESIQEIRNEQSSLSEAEVQQRAMQLVEKMLGKEEVQE